MDMVLDRQEHVIIILRVKINIHFQSRKYQILLNTLILLPWYIVYGPHELLLLAGVQGWKPRTRGHYSRV